MYADVTGARTNLRWPRRTSGWRVAGSETVMGLSGKGKDAALPRLSCRGGHAKVISILSRLGAMTYRSSRNAHQSSVKQLSPTILPACCTFCKCSVCQKCGNAVVSTGVLHIIPLILSFRTFCVVWAALTREQQTWGGTCWTRDTCASRLASALIFLGIPRSFSVLNSMLLVPDGLTLICSHDTCIPSTHHTASSHAADILLVCLACLSRSQESVKS